MSRDGEIVEFANMHDASCWYVRGHLTADEALQACDEYWMDYELFDTVDVPETPIGFGPCMHGHGRIVVPSQARLIPPGWRDSLHDRR